MLVLPLMLATLFHLSEWCSRRRPNLENLHGWLDVVRKKKQMSPNLESTNKQLSNWHFKFVFFLWRFWWNSNFCCCRDYLMNGFPAVTSVSKGPRSPKFNPQDLNSVWRLDFSGQIRADPDFFFRFWGNRFWNRFFSEKVKLGGLVIGGSSQDS